MEPGTTIAVTLIFRRLMVLVRVIVLAFLVLTRLLEALKNPSDARLRSSSMKSIWMICLLRWFSGFSSAVGFGAGKLITGRSG